MFLVAVCSSAPSQASFSHGGGHQQLSGVPDISDYGKLTYPKFDVIHLGLDIKNSLPPATVQITEYKTVKIPQPYPVKIPVPHPVVVPVAKPYPVVETKILKVPVPVPHEVIKQVPVHIEVSKPFPVPSGHYHHQADEGAGGDSSYGGSFGGHGQSGEEGYGYGDADQSQTYVAQVEAQNGWSPVAGNHEQMNEQEH